MTNCIPHSNPTNAKPPNSKKKTTTVKIDIGAASGLSQYPDVFSKYRAIVQHIIIVIFANGIPKIYRFLMLTTPQTPIAKANKM
ncbi:MAG: hypothetical protein RSD39_04745 [Oscillospiraceae bacterium]